MSIPSSSYECPASFFSLPSYSYEPLDIGQNEIRLIKLQDPIKSQPLCGNIIRVPLSAELRYWALSYCWGSLARKRTIILDGKTLQITVNLEDALHQLGNSYGLLWVDAICINQEDIPERSREVLRMGDIYSLASGVVAWLGVATKTSDRAMDFLQELATKRLGSQYDEYLKDPGKFKDEWIALKDLSKNGYWSRTWVIQEVALCRRSKIVHCGTKSLPWDIFEDVFGDSIFDDCISDVIVDLQEILEVSAGHANSRMLFNFERDPGFGDASIGTLFLSTNRFLATDPRDKIYGMLALGEKLRQVVPHPNYANSKDVVFRDWTKAMLANGYSLDLICFKLPTHVNRSDVVSWVPDWDVQGNWLESPDFLVQALWDNRSKSAYSADAGKDADISYVGDGSILRVRGISYDKVDGLGSTETNGWLLSEDATRKRHNVVEPDHRQNAYGSDVDTFRALKQLSQETFQFRNFRAPQGVFSLNNEYLAMAATTRRIQFRGQKSSTMV